MAPITAFTSSSNFVCSGDLIQFYDMSSCIPNTYLDTTNWPGITFGWTFTNGTNTYTSNLQNPIMNFPVSGVYDVTLTVSNAGSYTVQYTDGNGCQSPPSNAVVVTQQSNGVALPIAEGFVGAAFPPTNWTIFDGGSNGITWERDGANGTAPTAGNSTVIDNFSTNTAGDQDALFVEAMDLTSYTSAQLTFDVAYARYDATFFDQLAVVVSTDCGQNYSTIYSKSGTTLATEPGLAAAYTSPSV